MIVEQFRQEQELNNIVNCGICNKTIHKHGNFKEIGASLSIVCTECAEEFLDEEIELMGNIFMVFGGYFGKLKRSDTHSRMMLKEIIITYIEQGKNISKIENDVHVLHQIFLNGISLLQLSLELVLIE